MIAGDSRPLLPAVNAASTSGLRWAAFSVEYDNRRGLGCASSKGPDIARGSGVAGVSRGGFAREALIVEFCLFAGTLPGVGGSCGTEAI